MIAFILAALILSAPARAAEEPQAAASVTVLKDRFIEATGAAEKTKVIDQIAKTAPVSGQDVAQLGR